MWSAWDRLTTVSTSRPAGSEGEDDPDVSWDFSGLRDPGAVRDFMSACDHCLSDCSDDGHSLGDEGCDPTRECCNTQNCIKGLYSEFLILCALFAS
jgi:hypothetical protein